MNLTDQELVGQALAHMEKEIKISYHKAPGIGGDEHVTLEGSQPCLFSAACVIVKAIIEKESPESRESYLELIKDIVLEELKEEDTI